MTTLELEARLNNLLSTAQAETADVDIFTPIAEKEECPICFIPLPLSMKIEGDIVFMPCCGKMICCGCIYKNVKTENAKGVPIKEHKCAFCRQLIEPKSIIKSAKKLMKRNNPHAFMRMADHYKTGDGVFQSNTRALEMRICAAELGHADAFLEIADNYEEGIAVDQDWSKALGFYEVAAKKGSIEAHKWLSKS